MMRQRNSAYEAVAIGTSAGAVEVLSAILPALPKDYPLPVMVVVHLPPEKKSVLAELLQSKSQVTVREAEDKEPVLPGHVYLAPPDYHLQIEQNKTLSLSSDEPELYSRPSINVLFETAADAYGSKLIGIVLTGANSDGARGLKTIISHGGKGIVQHPSAAYASTMPQAALDVAPQAQAMEIPDIIQYLKEVGGL